MDEVVLITIVGDRDPDWARVDKVTGTADIVDGPVLTYINSVINNEVNNHLFPHQVYALYTPDEDRPERLNLLMERLREKNIPCTPIRLTDLKDVSSLKQVLEAFGNAIETIIGKHQESTLTVLSSPGTPQMQIAWVVLVNEGRLNAKLLRVIDPNLPKHKNKPLPKGGIVEESFSPIFETEKLQRAISLMRQYRFHSASELFHELTKKSYRADIREASTIAFLLCNAWWHLESLNYSEAILSTDNALRLSALPIDVRNYLEVYSRTLRLITKEEPRETALNWLWAADRALRAGRRVDCVWRCQTAFEVMLRLELKSFQTRDWSGDMPTVKNGLRQRSPDGIDRIAIKTIECFTLKNGKIGDERNTMSLLQATEDYSDIRHKLVHNGRVCENDVAVETLRIYTLAIGEYLNIDPMVVEGFPFSHSCLESVFNLIVRELGFK